MVVVMVMLTVMIRPFIVEGRDGSKLSNRKLTNKKKRTMVTG